MDRLRLWRQAPLEEVLRIVCEGQHWMGHGAQAQPGELKLPNKGSISQGAQVISSHQAGHYALMAHHHLGW